jgi:regulatory protein
MAPRTRGQLEDALRRRGIPDEAAATVLERLAETGLIDDAAFARAWVESRHYRRGLSRRTLSAELHRRGVDDEDVREAVETLSPEQEIATAKALAEKKLKGTRGQPADARVRRVAGMLARKGYPPGLAFRVIREAMEQEGASLAAAGLELDEDFAPNDEDEDEDSVASETRF